MASDPRATPAMRQYQRFKAAHPDCLLLFRMGDFYELFDDDAITAHRCLGLTLTERTPGVPMAGVPHHAVEGYLRRLVEQGHRVAVCEQIEDPAQAKGIVERAVTRVLTPGTLVDESLLDDARPNLLGAVLIEGTGDGAYGVAAIAEVSTGEFTLHRLPAGAVLDELARLGPAELLHPDDELHPLAKAFAARHGCVLTARAAWTFRPADAAEILRRQFEVASLAGFGLDDGDEIVRPAGALVRYLQETQAPPIAEAVAAGANGDRRDRRREPERSDDGRLRHLRPPRLVEPSEFLQIDATSLRSLEIERTMRSGTSEGALLSVLQRCRTPMGRRLLRQWLCCPLRSRPAIEERQRAVAAMVEDRAFAEALCARLADVQDVARIAARLALGRATPRDLVGLGRSAIRLVDLRELLEGRPAFAARREVLQRVSGPLLPLAERIVRFCVDAPPPHLREGGLFREGADEVLDEARLLQRDAGAWLGAYQRELIEQTGIPSLKVGFNRVFGYYIEVTNAHAAKTPPTFVRRQTLRGAERYVTPELKEHEDKVLSAESRALERERVLFEELCAEAAALAGPLGEFADAVAALDVLACLAENAVRWRYTRPEIVDEPMLCIVDGRHPVLDRTLAERFVPNDCLLRCPPGLTLGDASEDGSRRGGPTCAGDVAGARASLALITGPNMAGKSTFIRQVALIALLAHVGSFVPARRAVIGLCDRIFTRIGASDELHAGQSTFMVEMTETANILHHATARSLVVLDEIGRGTSTLDGLSLAWAVAETLAARGCRTLFATHYHELTGLAERHREVANLQVEVREWGDQIVFLHRIVPGRSDRSYGIHVARLAGLPAETVRRAEEILETLAVQAAPPAPAALDRTAGVAGAQTSAPSAPSAGEQLALFAVAPAGGLRR